jgi:lysylphosphatidylglycerol synthetase-like protein (DUF2156 family)
MSASRQRNAPDRTTRNRGLQVRLEDREVKAADPQLSPETNQRLTAELQEVIGAEHVQVPADRPHGSRGELPPQHDLSAFLNLNRLAVLFGVGVAVVVGGVISLTTGDWWFLVLAAGVHALGTMTMYVMSFRITAITEHPSPTVAAAMAEEGVRSPDARFSRMVDEFRTEPEPGAAEILSPDSNERTVPAVEAPATAGAEQATAMTPTAMPSASAPPGGTPDAIISVTAITLLILSIVLPATMGGGWLWLTVAVMAPICAGWFVLQATMLRHPERMHISSGRPLLAIILCTAAAVAIFCAIVAAVPGH